MPLTAHSICARAMITPARELATARAKIMWQCVDQMTCRYPGMFIDQTADQAAIFGRMRITHRVGTLMTVAPERDGDVDGLAQEVEIGARRVLGRPFDHRRVFAAMRDRGADRLQHSVLAHAQLVLHVDGLWR